jgi:hypothetical protein
VRLAEPPVVVTVTVTVAGVDPMRVTEFEERAHVDWVGAPLQLRATVSLNPPAGATVTE